VGFYNMFKKTVILFAILIFSCSVFAQRGETRGERNERISRNTERERAERAPVERAERPQREPTYDQQMRDLCKQRVELERENNRIKRGSMENVYNTITNGGADKQDAMKAQYDKQQCEQKENRVRNRHGHGAELKDPASYERTKRTPSSSGFNATGQRGEVSI
jgi:hypothetical protein